jgi:hypothetical protein
MKYPPPAATPPSGSEDTVLKFLCYNGIISLNANTLGTSHTIMSDTTTSHLVSSTDSGMGLLKLRVSLGFCRS